MNYWEFLSSQIYYKIIKGLIKLLKATGMQEQIIFALTMLDNVLI
jgi:hypothetical protein